MVIRLPRPNSRVDTTDVYTITLTELLEIQEWLDTLDVEFVPCPFPQPTPPIGGGLIWKAFTADGLLEYVTHILSNACIAYEELASSSVFSRCSALWGRRSFGPLAVVGYLKSSGDGAWMEYVLVPHEFAEITRPTLGHSDCGTMRAFIDAWDPNDKSTDGRLWDYFNKAMVWMQEQSISIDYLGWAKTGEAIRFSPRPASELAARWVADDLKVLGLCESMPLRFER